MSEKEAKLVPTYGYHATEEPQIFNIPAGGKLPDGWHDHPDKAKAAPEPKNAKGKAPEAE
ncbi:MAG TPA: hypothetical protein VFB29_00345 [Pseudolabrys sp.]|nr:hypothetical protein [Pseudolabrys sp.]